MKLLLEMKDASMEIDAEPGARLDDLILSAGVLLDRPCGGRGKCGKCRVKAGGELSPLTENELKHLGEDEIKKGIRLACQTKVLGEARVQMEAPAVFTDKSFSTGADLSKVPGPLGLAIDLGTTTVACFITGLEEGRVFAGHATLNLQTSHGAEVMSRLGFAEKNQELLRELAWKSVAEAARGLGLDASARQRVERATAVGNSAMHHLALGLPVGTLLRSPFEPSRTGPVEYRPEAIGSLFPGLSEVRFAPLIGGFVGSDALACMLSFHMEKECNALAIDLGTNGEVMLAAGGRLMAASTAAGPAFEGVNISCGMRAGHGAISGVKWSRDHGLELSTIGGGKPKGLSGCGLLSAVTALIEAGAIEPSGRIAEPGSAPGIKIMEGRDGKSVMLSPGIFLSQNDVRELQKAKGAIRAAVEILLERAGMETKDLERVILTGSFGGKMDPAEVMDIGLLPGFRPSFIHSIPNGAGLGAAMMLDPEMFDTACGMAERTRHVELNLDPDFMDRYVASMILSSKEQGVSGAL